MAEPTAIKEIVESTSESLKPKQKKGRGGARKNAGRKKGKLEPKTYEAMKVRDAFNLRVMKHADRLLNAQLGLAVGEQVLMVKVTKRGPKGGITGTEYEQVRDETLIKEFLDDSDGHPTSLGREDEWYYLSTKPANNMAIDSLLNRALGKVPDKLEVTGRFFSEEKLTIEVVGDREDIIDINSDGQIGDGTPEADVLEAPEHGVQPPEPPAGS